MDYDTARHFADSWGLIFLGLVFAVCIAWVFRPHARDHYNDAANLIFDEDKQDG